MRPPVSGLASFLSLIRRLELEPNPRAVLPTEHVVGLVARTRNRSGGHTAADFGRRRVGYVLNRKEGVDILFTKRLIRERQVQNGLAGNVVIRGQNGGP